MKNVFVWGEHSYGVANARDHLCVTSLPPLPKDFKNVEAAVWESSKVWKAIKQSTLQNLLLAPKYKAKQSLTFFFFASVYMLFCKFGQHNNNWKSGDMCKDHSWFKAHVYKGKTSTVKLVLKVKKNAVDLNEKQTNII